MAGAPKHNLNGIVNGTQISRLTLGALPSIMSRELSYARKYRRELEALVTEVKGCVDLRDAHVIDEAATAEAHAGVCRWLMRQKINEMSPADIRACSAEMVKAKQARNKAFDALNLNATPDDVFDALYTVVDDDDDAPTSDPDESTPDTTHETSNTDTSTQGDAATDEQVPNTSTLTKEQDDDRRTESTTDCIRSGVPHGGPPTPC